MFGGTYERHPLTPSEARTKRTRRLPLDISGGEEVKLLWDLGRVARTDACAKPACFTGDRSGSVRGMSSPEAAKAGAFGHAVSPLNH